MLGVYDPGAAKRAGVKLALAAKPPDSLDAAAYELRSLCRRDLVHVHHLLVAAYAR